MRIDGTGCMLPLDPVFFFVVTVAGNAGIVGSACITFIILMLDRNTQEQRGVFSFRLTLFFSLFSLLSISFPLTHTVRNEFSIFI